MIGDEVVSCFGHLGFHDLGVGAVFALSEVEDCDASSGGEVIVEIGEVVGRIGEVVIRA